MTLKKLFVVVAAITAGIVVGLAAIVGTVAWWESKPTPRDSSSLVARYDGTYFGQSETPKLVELRYLLENKSTTDIVLKGSGLTVFIRREDGSLFDLRKLHDQDQSDVEIPAGERVLWFLSTGLTYERNDDRCKEFEVVKEPSKEQSQAFLDTCYPWLRGFRMQAKVGNLLVELPSPVSPTKK